MSKKKEKPIRDLKIFLLKEGVTNDAQSLFQDAVEHIDIPNIGVLYYKPSFFSLSLIHI